MAKLRIGTITNEQRQTEKLVKQLQAGNYDRARLELNTIQKSARNRLDYLERTAAQGKYSGLEAQVLSQEITRAKQQYKNVQENVAAVRDTIRREELKERLARTGKSKLYGKERIKAERELASVRERIRDVRGVRKAIQELNAYTAKRTAMQRQQAYYQSIGTTTRTVKAQQKLEARWLNMIYNNRFYDLPKKELDEIDEILTKYIGYSINTKIEWILSQVNKTYGSDYVYTEIDKMFEHVKKLFKDKKKKMNSEQLKEAQEAIDRLEIGIEVGGA